MISTLRNLWRQPEKAAMPANSQLQIPKGVELEEGFPAGLHVYGFGRGPQGGEQVLVGAGDPATGLGAIFMGVKGGPWTRIELPDETAFVSKFLKLSDGRYLAGGMSLIGRGALLMSDPTARDWGSVDLDLHPYCAVADLVRLPNGEILMSTGQMVTQGKTKAVLFRSMDGGVTWGKEEQKLPISQFLSFAQKDGLLYAGTAGDHDPLLYRSADGGRAWESLPPFPAYKTFKMIHVQFVDVGGQTRLYVVLWGYKTDIADRVVRLYRSLPDFQGWEELPPIEDSHFLFSFFVAADGTFYAGSEKGRVYRSMDFGITWDRATEFRTNIGGYAFFETPKGDLWVGKDFVPPSDFSLWRISRVDST